MLPRSWRLAVLACLTVLLGTLVHPSGTAEAASRPLVAVVGDSYTVGRGATTTAGAWWHYTVADLGWNPGTIVGDSGGGYVDRGTAGTFADALRAHPINKATNYVLLQGGLNDAGHSPTAVMAGVRDVLALIQAQAPHAIIIVIGAFLPSAKSVTPNYIDVARAIGDKRALGRTRYLTGFMCSYSLAADGIHPDTAGHRAIGHFVSWHIAHGLDNWPPFHKDPSGTFYTA